MKRLFKGEAYRLTGYGIKFRQPPPCISENRLSRFRCQRRYNRFAMYACVVSFGNFKTA
ncbi:MAG: hypothetical protein LBJ00_17885 [Planctomycetaceae bacterium]|nr:hypothetical protein [Planctomycetaceae bacterium]